ncbi:MAG: hypothetical protein HYR88_15000 [Verrucomicrobia bacterium]|nr:hypothetical protein [Verrucomicrobiota bacterium]
METPVMADGLSPATPPDASFPASMGDSGSGRPGTLAVSARPGLVLSDGSFVAQATESATRSQFRLAAGELPSLAPVEWVSRVYLAEIPYAALEKLDPARAGALLHDGDFIEGEFQSLDAAELRMSSILFGNHRVKRERVAAVVLRALPRSGSPWRIATLGGSLFRPSSVAIETGGLKLSGLPSGFLRLPERQLLEARREDKR